VIGTVVPGSTLILAISALATTAGIMPWALLVAAVLGAIAFLISRAIPVPLLRYVFARCNSSKVLKSYLPMPWTIKNRQSFAPQF
jgi:membrane protein DedA with SNARE-associated domain